MKRILWVPADMDKLPVELDLDTEYRSQEGVKEGDPYRVGKMLHWEINSVENVWQERVRSRAFAPEVALFVDEEGLLKGLPFNMRATVTFYPYSPGISGDVFFCKLEDFIDYVETDEDCYSESKVRIVDNDWKYMTSRLLGA